MADYMVKCKECNTENVVTRSNCRNCGALLSRTVEIKNNNNEHINYTTQNVYSNPVAKSFKNWSNGVLIVGAIIMVIMIIVLLQFKQDYFL